MTNAISPTMATLDLPISINATRSSAIVSARQHMLPRLGDYPIKQIHNLGGHKSSVNAVAFSPHGDLVATASDDTTVRLWHSATGVRQNTLRGHQSMVATVKFSSDGKMVASGSFDGTINLWLSATGEIYKSLKGTSEILTLTFSPDSSLITSVCYDMTLERWHFPTGQKLEGLRGDIRPVAAAAFSSDGEWIAFASDDKMVRLRNLKTWVTGKVLIRHRKHVTAVAFSADCKLVASASYDMTVQIWELEKGIPHRTMNFAKGPITAMAFSPTGNFLVCESHDSRLLLCDYTTGSQFYEILGDEIRKTMCVKFSPDGFQVACTYDDGRIKLLHLDVKAINDMCRGHQDSGGLRVQLDDIIRHAGSAFNEIRDILNKNDPSDLIEIREPFERMNVDSYEHEERERKVTRIREQIERISQNLS